MTPAMMDEGWKDGGRGCRTGKRRRLGVGEGENVEMSYLAKGFLRSWHLGVAVGCDKVSRTMEHTNLMNDDSTSTIVEDIPVSAEIEGTSDTTVQNCSRQTRPVASHLFSTQSSGISYGLCVDALVDGVWFEGVIFDHQESSKGRRVFFPDQGDQQMITVDRLRLTQDWDEVYGIWKPRGKWLLIQVIQDFENEGGLPVSISEIWYDLRATRDFKDQIKNWTSGTKDIWYTLVAELIQELWSVVIGTRVSEQSVNNVLTSVDVCMPIEDVHCPEVPGHQSDSLVEFVEGLNQVDYDNGFLQSRGTGQEVEKSRYCLKALDDFISLCRNKSCSPDLRKKLHVVRHRARSCLIAARWKLVENAQGRKHYVSPDGKRFGSLVTACEAWRKIEENWDNRTDSTGITYSQECGVQVSSSNLKYIDDKAEDISSTEVAATWKRFKLSNAVYCPDAVELYAQIVGDKSRNLMLAKFDRGTLAEKVKMHLLALGWSIEFKRDTRTRFRFFAPQGRIYYSLIEVCYDLMKEHQKENEEVEPEYLPYAITEYESYIDSLVQDSKQEISHADIQFLRLKAKKHLLFMGWRWLNEKENSKCYGSPSGSTFCSLFLACNAYSKEHKNFTMKPLNLVNNQKNRLELTAKHGESIQDVGHMKLSTVSNAATSNKFPEPAHLVHGDAVRESRFACSSSCQAGQITVNRESKRRMTCQSSRRVHRSGKTSRNLVASPNLHTAKTPLSWLIDNGILLPRQKVYCVCKRDGQSRKEGRLSRDGIKCICCRTVFNLANFAAHGGYSTERPTSSIFLSDGRSLLQCEIQMMHASKYKVSPHMRLKGDYSQHLSDAICSICNDGGELILCDHCPSAFHITCIGLEDVPEGSWFCPSCRCGICGLSHYNHDVEQFTNTTVLYCDQCESEHHVGCLQLGSCPTGNWFCSNKCSDIFSRLHKLIGRSNPTSSEGLSWTLLRWRYNDNLEVRRCDPETAAHHSKLSIALDVLHECFVPIVEDRTQSDLVADVIFNKESELNRLNFWGFYTMVLEKGDELLSVATFRVFGEKVAEMPLIGTRDFCRRKGMCRLLVNELEKLLRSLGVERLVLPAVPQLLETWTGSFGFSVMRSSDRLELSRHTLLSFAGTTMCQKTL